MSDKTEFDFEDIKARRAKQPFVDAEDETDWLIDEVEVLREIKVAHERMENKRIESLEVENTKLKEEVKHLRQIERFYYDLNNPEKTND